MERKAFMCDMIRTELEDIVGVENVSTKDSDRATYGVDYFWIGRMWVDHGLTPPMPDIIVRPGCTEEVSKILKIANYYKIPVNIWGGGSGSQGGALPMAGGIMMDMKRMSHLIEIDEVSRTITAEAGMIFQQLEWYANERGYSCQHIPSCLTCGTIGGALGHRGIGIMSSKYGKIDDMCISMEVVLPNGDIINTLPVPKHAAGPDLNEIFIGSEGTLGVITKATFKLFEQPESRQHRAFLFPDMHSGYMAGRDIMQKVKPSILRFFDEYVAEVHKHMDYEEQKVFPYVEGLLRGEHPEGYSIDIFRRHHDQVEAKLAELKRIIIRYYPSGSTNELNGVLFDIFTCERDLASHNDIEDRLFIPAIKRLEERTGSGVSGTQPGDMPPKQPAPKKGGCR